MKKSICKNSSNNLKNNLFASAIKTKLSTISTIDIDDKISKVVNDNFWNLVG